MNSRTELLIDNEALLHNVECIKSFLENSSVPVHIIAMVKANAYGHGLKHVSQILEPVVDVLGVACLEEAKALRDIMPNKSIMIMGGVFAKDGWDEVFEGRFDVVVHSFWQIESLLAFSATKPIYQPINAWLKIETGMHRLGFASEDVLNAYKMLNTCAYINKPIGFMTHFACADELDNPMTQKQIEQFESMMRTLPNHLTAKRSLANSAGIIGWPNARQGYVRPGIMLYGISPFANKTGRDLGLEPVMTFQSHIVAIKTCKMGESVGYGAIWSAAKPAKVGIVAAGYGDGYPRHVTADAKVWIKGKYYPVVGRVSMDMLAIDISEESSVQIGDVVELWGKHLPVEKVASFANTSPYELVTQARPRG